MIDKFSVYCRHFKRKYTNMRDDIESIVNLFLVDSFDSNELYIISPWITFFKFCSHVVRLPYVLSKELYEILRALNVKGVKIYIATRCFDDSIQPDVFYMLYRVIDKTEQIPVEITAYIKDSLRYLLDRIDFTEQIKSYVSVIKFDIGPRNRLHSKIYINDFYALIGSANFTRKGIISDGNLECLLKINNKTKLYEKVKEHAIRYMDELYDYDRCVRSTINYISKLLGERITSLQGLKRYIEDVINSL